MRTNLKILNLTCTSANTEYTIDLPLEATEALLQCRTAAHVIRIAFQDGDAAAARPHFSVKGSQPPQIIPCFAGGPRVRTLRVQSPDAGAVLEILAWG